jgi:hypothetical protein
VFFYRGFHYDFDIGTRFEVLTATHVKIDKGEAEAVRATSECSWE